MEDRPGMYDDRGDATWVLIPLCAAGLVVWGLAIWKVADLVRGCGS